MLLADWIVEHLMNVDDSGFFAWIGYSPHVRSLFIAALLMLLIFPYCARQEGLVPRGLRNLIEVILVFLRDEVARPILGAETERYLPVIWNFFFFILFCNLLGLVPGMATATGQIWVTGTLALTAFLWYHACGIWEQGLVPYLKNVVPPGLPIWLVPILYVIELVGYLAKPFALMVRLWANMTGGHAVLYVFVGFVFIFKEVWYVSGPISVMGATAVYFLELLVAFIQAFVFTTLVTVFLGAAVHPEH